MTPRFEPDFESAHAFIPVYDGGAYRVKIGSVTPFIADSKKNQGEKIAGLRFNCYMYGRYDQKGNLQKQDEGQVMEQPAFFIHTQGAYGMTKQFLMACLGFGRKEEDKANKEVFAKHKGEFYVDVDPNDSSKAICGKAYELVQDKYVDVTLKKGSYQQKDEHGNPVGEPREQQEYSNWTPAK